MVLLRLDLSSRRSAFPFRALDNYALQTPALHTCSRSQGGCRPPPPLRDRRRMEGEQPAHARHLPTRGLREILIMSMSND